MRRDWRICVKRRKNGSDYGSSFVVTLSYEKSRIPPETSTSSLCIADQMFTTSIILDRKTNPWLTLKK